jgi:hypothetical protein
MVTLRPVWVAVMMRSADPGVAALPGRARTPRAVSSSCAVIAASLPIDVTMNVYTEVSDAKTLQALKRLGKQLDTQP